MFCWITEFSFNIMDRIVVAGKWPQFRNLLGMTTEFLNKLWQIVAGVVWGSITLYCCVPLTRDSVHVDYMRCRRLDNGTNGNSSNYPIPDLKGHGAQILNGCIFHIWQWTQVYNSINVAHLCDSHPTTPIPRSFQPQESHLCTQNNVIPWEMKLWWQITRKLLSYSYHLYATLQQGLPLPYAFHIALQQFCHLQLISNKI